MALSDTKARAAKWDGKDYYLNDGNGLYLYVRKASKRWIVRRKRDGKMRVTSLGKYPDIGLKAARSNAAASDTKRHPSTVTVAELADEYRAIIERDNKRPHLTTGYIDRGLPPALLKTRVADVVRTDLVMAIKGYKTRPGFPGERAKDTFRGILRQLFGLGLELGYCDTNPADGITKRVTGFKAASRTRVLSDDEIRQVWNETHPNANLLRFLLLTGVRIGEAQKAAPWTAQGPVWDIPAEHSKNGCATWVHLTDTAKAQLTDGPFETRPGSVQHWLQAWCDRNEISPRFTAHDLRRTVSTRLNEAGVEPYVVEKLLNHRMQGVMAVYNRAEYAEQRVKAYEKLEQIIMAVVK